MRWIEFKDFFRVVKMFWLKAKENVLDDNNQNGRPKSKADIKDAWTTCLRCDQMDNLPASVNNKKEDILDKK